MTDTTTQTLTEWLLDRIAEDEAAARAAQSTTADGASWGWAEFNSHGQWVKTVEGVPSPARVLAECAAKRRIVELAEEASGLDAQVDGEFRVGPRDTTAEPYVGDLILRALASVYADAPGFREEWRA